MKRAYIEISNACNLSCGFCPSPGIAGQRQWMTQDLFETTLDQLQGVVEEVYLHVLGEPLLHPLLESFLAAVNDRNLKINLTTNGLLIESRASVLLRSAALRQINFSIHALQELDDAAEAARSLDTILEFVRQAMQQRPEIFINLRLWNETAAAGEWNERVWRQITERFNRAAAKPAFDPRSKKQELGGRVCLNLDTRFDWPADTAETAPRTEGTCQALKTHCAILADGRIVACCLDYQGDLELGQVREGGIAAALAGPRARAMRNGFDRRVLVEPFCRHCTFCRRFG
ncbi:radical SAM/SPASM domain-containing protein [Pontiella sp.]|uniref:radical SAM/SPASM domain-containing protein n=1 Tax=Pontiella sp. TaxID=2837462 RepID=UPI00356ACBD4